MMDPDGTQHGTVARGLRNAVGLVFVPEIDGGALFATNMGADHLGDSAPEDQFFELDAETPPGTLARQVGFHFTNWLEQPIPGHRDAVRGGNETLPIPADYGWPTCYFSSGTAHADPLVSAPKPGDHIFPPAPAGPPPPQADCATVPAAYTTFAAHSSPLGFAYFGASDPILGGSFLVALHGAGHPRIGTGYRIVRFSAADRRPKDFMTGFLVTQDGKPVVKGRPCGILRTGPDTFLLSDDLDGVIYSIHPR
jgi:glucose/arabinose dehydrogenase